MGYGLWVILRNFRGGASAQTVFTFCNWHGEGHAGILLEVTESLLHLTAEVTEPSCCHDGKDHWFIICESKIIRSRPNEVNQIDAMMKKKNVDGNSIYIYITNKIKHPWCTIMNQWTNGSLNNYGLTAVRSLPCLSNWRCSSAHGINFPFAACHGIHIFASLWRMLLLPISSLWRMLLLRMLLLLWACYPWCPAEWSSAPFECPSPRPSSNPPHHLLLEDREGLPPAAEFSINVPWCLNQTTG